MTYRARISVRSATALFAAAFAASATANPVTFLTNESAFTSLTGPTLSSTFDEPFWDPYQGGGPATLAFNGITYTCLDASPVSPNLFISSPGQPNFGVPPTTRVLTVSGNEDVRLDLPPGTFSVGFDFYSNAFAPAQFFVESLDGNTYTFTNPQPINSLGFVGFASGTPLLSVRWLATNGQAINTGIDNVVVGSIPAPTCGPDVTGDNQVDLLDLNLVLANFGQTTPVGDATRDGAVDLNDLNTVLAAFGTVCP